MTDTDGISNLPATALLRGKVAIVTGANTGIGKETARGLMKLGAHVVLACRDLDRAEAALAELLEDPGAGSGELQLLDLASFASIHDAAGEIQERHPAIHILVNNAGIWASHRTRSADGYELNWAVNHLGPFLFTNLLLDAIKAAAPARIVNVNSNSHRQARMRWKDVERGVHFTGLGAYTHAKLASMMFTRALAQRLERSGVTVNAVHPGIIASGMTRDLPGFVNSLVKLLFRSPADGAGPCIHAATAEELANVTGAYFSRFRLSEASEAALNDDNVERLWQLSVESTGLDRDEPLVGAEIVPFPTKPKRRRSSD